MEAPAQMHPQVVAIGIVEPERVCNSFMCPTLSHHAVSLTCEARSSQEDGEQREEGVKLLILVAATRNASEEHRVPDRKAEQTGVAAACGRRIRAKFGIIGRWNMRAWA